MAYYTQWAAGDDLAKQEARRAPGRVEFLPVEWNLSVRDDADGTMTRLQQVTPTSVPLLRAFANEVVLDILFYEQVRVRARVRVRVRVS